MSSVCGVVLNVPPANTTECSVVPAELAARMQGSEALNVTL
jgi:hypothetical protein